MQKRNKITTAEHYFDNKQYFKTINKNNSGSDTNKCGNTKLSKNIS